MITLETLSEKGKTWYRQLLAEKSRKAIDAAIFKMHKELKGEEVKWIAQQIEGFRVAASKFPSWQQENMAFPPKKSLEQSSSEVTARFKASLFSGKKIIDLTGGMGVDTWAFSKVFEEAIYVEANEELAKRAAHNFHELGGRNIQVACSQAERFVEALPNADLVFIDPDRRPDAASKVSGLENSLPNVFELKDRILAKAEHFLIKASPLVDISQLVKTLPELQRIWVVAVDNDCKEVLALLSKKTPSPQPEIETVHFKSGKTEKLTARFPFQKVAPEKYSQPLIYLYEPNVAIMKAGSFSELLNIFPLKKLHPNSHLFTSETLVEGFPGRSFSIETVYPFNKKGIKALKALESTNITTRNFTISPDQLRNKLGLKEGGTHYLFATTNWQQEKIIIHCQKA